MLTPFQAFYIALKLNSLNDEDALMPVFSEGNIRVYNDITAEDIDAMAAYAPAKIVCAEQGFKDDTALSNAHYILRDKQIELKLV